MTSIKLLVQLPCPGRPNGPGQWARSRDVKGYQPGLENKADWSGHSLHRELGWGPEGY